jgi:hypothetical protein
VFEVKFAFSVVIDVVGVELGLELWNAPPVVLPVVFPLSVVPMLAIPLAPTGELGVGEKTELAPNEVGTLPKFPPKMIWNSVTPEKVPNSISILEKFAGVKLNTTEGTKTCVGITTGFASALPAKFAWPTERSCRFSRGSHESGNRVVRRDLRTAARCRGGKPTFGVLTVPPRRGYRPTIDV